jgi:tetraacyldisaccharide 4'-kinase
MRTPRFWQSCNATSLALLPASLLYRLGAWADRRFTTPQRATIPVISIGNVTVGGAGKTPTTLALIPILRDLGHTPHILTRGYKGAALTAHRVSETDTWQQVGDEALLLAKAAPTWVGRDRLASANAAAKAGATILLCDDALQHHILHKDLSLLVIDGAYGVGNAQLLPAGPLRESLKSAATRSDAVVLIGADAHHLMPKIRLPILRADLRYIGDTSFLSNTKWLAFAGIGRPEKFFATLHELGAELVATRSFGDHHPYTADDIDDLQMQAASLGARLITTTKDHVKLPASAAADVTALPIELIWQDRAALRVVLDKLAAILSPIIMAVTLLVPPYASIAGASYIIYGQGAAVNPLHDKLLDVFYIIDVYERLFSAWSDHIMETSLLSYTLPLLVLPLIGVMLSIWLIRKVATKLKDIFHSGVSY